MNGSDWRSALEGEGMRSWAEMLVMVPAAGMLGLAYDGGNYGRAFDSSVAICEECLGADMLH